MAQNRDDSGLACEHPSGFWHSVLPERQWPSVVSAGCFGRQVYQDNARGSKRWSNCPVKTLSYLRRSWQALNKEYQRCCVKMQKFDVDTWVHQNVNVDAHLRSNPQQPTTPPPLSQTQVAEVQKILINAFKSNDRELFWKQFFQKLILSFARHFDSDEDMAETVLVDSWAGRGPPVVETVAGVPHVLRTYVGNPPGLYSPGAWVVSVGCWTQDPPRCIRQSSHNRSRPRSHPRHQSSHRSRHHRRCPRSRQSSHPRHQPSSRHQSRQKRSRHQKSRHQSSQKRSRWSHQRSSRHQLSHRNHHRRSWPRGHQRRRRHKSHGSHRCLLEAEARCGSLAVRTADVSVSG